MCRLQGSIFALYGHMKVFLAFALVCGLLLPLVSQAKGDLWVSRPVVREKSLQEEIFSPLSKEFKDKYREKFGQIDTETIVYQPTKFSTFDENRGAVQKIEEDNQKRRLFAEYMTKRLVEYHIDHYMRTQPQMQPIMQVKEQIQNVKVEVNDSVRLNMQYNFAGNMFDFLIDNPWVDSKVTLDMNSEDTHLFVSKDLNKKLKVNTNTAFEDGITSGEFVRRFERLNFSTSIGASTFFKEGGRSVRESKLLVGFAHSW